MAIVWTTTAGSLGTIEERVAYTKTLTATGATSFSVLAGSLPSGLYLTTLGVLKGTPSEVAQNTKSTFVIRATDGVASADRTFSLTVQGPDAPSFTTPAGTILNLTDGEFIEKKLKEFGIKVIKNIGKTGVVGILEGNCLLYTSPSPRDS